tara:strand:- start:5113 stop:6366 length:1254 start_codon:yes stop_codon:yes gene_type:complete
MSWENTHKDATIVDMHTHSTLKSFMFNRDLGGGKRRLLAKFFSEGFWPFSERITFPKLEEGGVDVVLSTAYTLEQGWIDDIKLIKFLLWAFRGVRKKLVDPTYFDATNAMLDEMENQVKAYNEKRLEESRPVSMAFSVDELLANIERGDISIIHSIEGGHCLNGELGKRRVEDAVAVKPLIEKEILDNLERFYNRGVAYLTLAHFYPNHIAPPVFPYPEYGSGHMDWKKALGRWDMNQGLTSIGKKVVQSMKDMGMLIDISHCTPKARQEVYDIVGNDLSRVFASHNGAFGINPDPYNLEDWEIKWLADHNGLLGVIFMNYWISPIDTGLGLKYIEQTIDYIRNVGGHEIIGIGTDYDGFTDPPDEMTDISELPRLTKYLSCLKSSIDKDKYPEQTIKDILGGNAMRFITEGWKKRA